MPQLGSLRSSQSEEDLTRLCLIQKEKEKPSESVMSWPNAACLACPPLSHHHQPDLPSLLHCQQPPVSHGISTAHVVSAEMEAQQTPVTVVWSPGHACWPRVSTSSNRCISVTFKTLAGKAGTKVFSLSLTCRGGSVSLNLPWSFC